MRVSYRAYREPTDGERVLIETTWSASRALELIELYTDLVVYGATGPLDVSDLQRAERIQRKLREARRGEDGSQA